MSSRLDLQSFLENLLGSREVYFQPLTSVHMIYPAIVYSISAVSVQHADDMKYRLHKAYELTYIHKNPDDGLTDSIMALPLCRFDRRYTSDNLYHDVFTLYY